MSHHTSTLREALNESPLATLNQEGARAMLDASKVVQVKAGEDLVAGDDSRPFAFLVVTGIFRTYGASESGKQTTLRFARRGALLGLPSLFHGTVEGVNVQAVVDASAVRLRQEQLQRTVQEDVGFAYALLLDQTALVNGYLQTLLGTTSTSLRQSVLRHLLDLASFRAADARLVAQVTQQQLADHCGTVREVVGRILKDLREEGLIITARDKITLLDPEALAASTWPRTF